MGRQDATYPVVVFYSVGSTPTLLTIANRVNLSSVFCSLLLGASGLSYGAA